MTGSKITRQTLALLTVLCIMFSMVSIAAATVYGSNDTANTVVMDSDKCTVNGQAGTVVETNPNLGFPGNEGCRIASIIRNGTKKAEEAKTERTKKSSN